MKTTLLLLFFLLNFKGVTVAQTISVSNPLGINLSWYDSLMINYIHHSNNDLIKIELQDSTNLQWLLDRVENRNGAKYLVFNIGHDVEYSDALIFASDGWLFIDSLKRNIYEYDLPNDSLIEWKK